MKISQSDGIRRYYTGYIFQDVEFLVLDGSDGGKRIYKGGRSVHQIQRLKTSLLQIRNYAGPQLSAFCFFVVLFFSSFFFYLVFFSWGFSLGFFFLFFFFSQWMENLVLKLQTSKQLKTSKLHP